MNTTKRAKSPPRRLGALALALLLALLACTSALAANDGVRLVKVEMNLSRLTVRVNQQRTLTASVGIHDPDRTSNTLLWINSGDDDWPVSWASSNPEVAAVDGDGLVTGVSPGTAVITATVQGGSRSGKTTQTQSDSCTVTVRGTAIKSDVYIEDTNTAQSATNSGERLDVTALRAAVEEALKAAPAGESTAVTYRNKTVLTTAALRGAAYTAQQDGREVTLRFQTLDENGAVQGQMTIRLQNAPADDHDVQVSVYTDAAHTGEALSRARAAFGEHCAVINLPHSGALGMEVQVAARVDLSGRSAGELTVYRFDSGTGAHTLLENRSCRIDANGYLHFTAGEGGDYVIVPREYAK